MKQNILLLLIPVLINTCTAKTPKTSFAADNDTAVTATAGAVKPTDDEVIKDTRDDATDSSPSLFSDATWVDTGYGFSVPNIMTQSDEIWVDDVPAYLNKWNYEEVCLAHWPLLGTWAVTNYPDIDFFLTETVKIKTITYVNSSETIFSGYADDGRIWYMNKEILMGGVVDHAKVLVLIYPKEMQSDVEELIDIVKRWR